MLFLFVCAIIVSLLYFYLQRQPITTIKYNDTILAFRVDIRQARQIPVYGSLPDFSNISNVTIVYVNTSDLQYVALQSFMITFNLKRIYRNLSISAQEVNDFILENGTFIAILPPSIANESAVRVLDNTIFISGKTSYELDLATTKFILALLNI